VQAPVRQFKVVTPAQKRREARNRLLTRLAIACGLLLAIGFGYFTWVSLPGTQAVKAPPKWPEASNLVRNFTAPTMVLFVEPEQAEASQNIEELDRLVKYNRLAAYVVFEGDQPESSLLAKARKLPNTTVVVDRQKREAEQFQVNSAGDCLLFDRHGKLQFHGDFAEAKGEAKQNVRFLLTGLPTSPVARTNQASAAAQE
jgi:hypothetical protein